MHKQHFNFPAFDAIEYTPELEFSNQRYVPLSPLKAGAVVHHSNPALLQPQSLQSINSSLYFAQKPLILYFYSAEWGQDGIAHLKQLNNLQQNLSGYPFTLLVVHTADDAERLKQVLWEEQIDLKTWQDEQHALAASLGIYSEQSPAWNTYAGIDSNIPLPGLYALGHDHKVVFDYANAAINPALPLACLEATLLQQAGLYAQKKSA